MESVRVLAGDCTVIEQSDDGREEYRGRVVTVVKPDDTVLVHDRDGYRPVAWLTRAEAVVWAVGDGTDAGARAGPDGRVGAAEDSDFALTARDGDRRLWVAAHERTGLARYPATAAGRPAGDCRCGGRLVRTGDAVDCLDCEAEYGLPRDATLVDERCDCGLPRLRVERGSAFDLCLDRNCSDSRSLDEAVRAAFDREWDCPNCGGDLRVLRRGGLLAGCERYPDCETGFALPSGTVVGRCDCGLPTFDAAGGRRCLDATCQRGTGVEGD